ncbi:hypothetical protein HY969_01905 [Candidatus Kaiserbacteria bacterium]|nr:hypothetical protein [Candidatus Kaiserbacteria bacterium]
MKLLFLLILLAAVFGTGYYMGKGGDIAALLNAGILKKDTPAGVSNEVIERKTSQTDQVTESAAIAANIVGTWKSTDDAKFSRTFLADGTVIDKYEGNEDATTEGMWKTFMGTDAENAPAPLDEGVVYLKITMPEEVLFLSIPKLTADALEMMYLSGGETLKFTRVR